MTKIYDQKRYVNVVVADEKNSNRINIRHAFWGSTGERWYIEFGRNLTSRDFVETPKTIYSTVDGMEDFTFENLLNVPIHVKYDGPMDSGAKERDIAPGAREQWNTDSASKGRPITITIKDVIPMPTDLTTITGYVS